MAVPTQMTYFTTLFQNVSWLDGNMSSPNQTNATMTAGPAIPACWPILIDPTTEELLDAVGSSPQFLAIIGSAIALTVFTVGIYLETLWFVCRKIPSRTKGQLAFIMGIYPVFSACSLLAMFVPRASVITAFTAHVYFSMALVQFIMLMTGYYGDKSTMLRKLEGQTIELATPPLTLFCFCLLPKIPVNKFTLPKFVYIIRCLVLQVAIIKPLFYFLGAVLWLNDTFIPGDFSSNGTYLWFNIIYVISTLIALNGIIIFFRLSREPLREYHITPKFFTVQLTLIFTNVQPLTIGLCAVAGRFECKPPFHPGMRALYYDSMLNIIEMFIFNIIATVCFRRMKGNMGVDQYLERRQYSRLSRNPYKQDPAVQMAVGDENDNKFRSDNDFVKTENDVISKQNGQTNDLWQQNGGRQDAPYLQHMVSTQPNGIVRNEAFHQHSPGMPIDEMDPEEDNRSSSGSILLSEADRETNV